MKKLILILVCVLSSYHFAAGQEAHDMNGNSLSIICSDGIGEGASVVFASAIASVIAAIFGAETHQELGWTPFLSLGYDHGFDGSRWCAGADAGFMHIGITDTDTGDKNHYYIGVLAAAGKYFYKPDGNCRLYGGLNLGAGAAGNETLEFFPAFQVNPIGMQLGSKRVSFVAELGFGYRGIVQMGLNIKL